MYKKYAENVVPKEIVDQLIADYDSRSEYDTDNMQKASPDGAQDLITPIVQKFIGTEWKYGSGNYYQHERPYLPHTDFREDWGESVNVVIPLRFEGTLQPNLVVFDQWYPKQHVTWCLDVKGLSFEHNTALEMRPYDDPDVQGKINGPIDDELYKKYLNYRPKEQWYGLTIGEVYSFVPGNMILFNNQLIHTTSQFQGKKLGIAIRYVR